MRRTGTGASLLSLSPSDVLGVLPPDATHTLTSFTETYLLPQMQQMMQQIDPEQYPAIAGAGATAVAAPRAWKETKAVQAQTKRRAAVASGERTYPESTAALYDLLDVGLPWEFGDAALVRPLLKQTQLESRPPQVVYDANKDGYNTKTFHQKVDSKGASIILCKAQGQWFGAYNPRGLASLGGSRPSPAALWFYSTNLFGFRSWRKLRAMGGDACASDLFDRGIYMGAEALIVPLDGPNPKSVASQLGTYFESGPQRKTTLLARPAVEARLTELKVLAGEYGMEEDIPNSGGVLDLGLY